MSKQERKSTMVELVTELKKLQSAHPNNMTKVELGEMILEAQAGEYHDYKNQKYVCGKVASSQRLRSLGFIPLAMRIEDGEFDEEADADDCEMLKREALAGGFNEEQCKKLFNL
jgi:hypothetical protein